MNILPSLPCDKWLYNASVGDCHRIYFILINTKKKLLIKVKKEKNCFQVNLVREFNKLFLKKNIEQLNVKMVIFFFFISTIKDWMIVYLKKIYTLWKEIELTIILFKSVYLIQLLVT